MGAIDRDRSGLESVRRLASSPSRASRPRRARTSDPARSASRTLRVRPGGRGGRDEHGDPRRRLRREEHARPTPLDRHAARRRALEVRRGGLGGRRPAVQRRGLHRVPGEPRPEPRRRDRAGGRRGAPPRAPGDARPQAVDRFARGAGDKPDSARHASELWHELRRRNVHMRTAEDDDATRDAGSIAAAGEPAMRESRRRSSATRKGLSRRAGRGEPVGAMPRGYGRLDLHSPRRRGDVRRGDALAERGRDPDEARRRLAGPDAPPARRERRLPRRPRLPDDHRARAVGARPGEPQAP